MSVKVFCKSCGKANPRGNEVCDSCGEPIVRSGKPSKAPIGPDSLPTPKGLDRLGHHATRVDDSHVTAVQVRCLNCGRVNNASSRFCNQCGKKLEGAAAVTPFPRGRPLEEEAPPVEAPAPAPPPPPPPPPAIEQTSLSGLDILPGGRKGVPVAPTGVLPGFPGAPEAPAPAPAAPARTFHGPPPPAPPGDRAHRAIARICRECGTLNAGFPHCVECGAALDGPAS